MNGSARSYPPLELVVLDLDGTLVDSRGDIATAANAGLVDLGLAPIDDATMCGFVGDGAENLMRRAARESIARSGRVASEDDLVALGRRGIDRYIEHYCRNPVARTTLMPGVAALLDELEGHVAIGVCTNKPRAPTDAVLAGMGLAPRLSVVVAGGDLPEKKPDPAPLLRAIASVGVSRDATLMIGDGPQDIGCAVRAGVRSIAVCGGFASRDVLDRAGATWVVATMDEARPIVRSLRAR